MIVNGLGRTRLRVFSEKRSLARPCPQPYGSQLSESQRATTFHVHQSGLLMPVILICFSALMQTACAIRSPDERLLKLAGSLTATTAQIEELLAKGADPNAVSDDSYSTPLLAAARLGRADIVKCLAAAGANIKRTNKYGHTALMKAAEGAISLSINNKPLSEESNYEDTIKLLIALGTPVDATDHLGCTALQLAGDELCIGEYSGGSKGDAEIVTKVVRLLLEGGADPGVGRRSVLHSLAMRGRTGAIEAIADTGKIDIHVRNITGETPLMVAVGYGHIDSVRLLAKRGSDINVPDNSGTTPLIMAIEKGDNEIVNLLLALGANPKQEDSEGKTPLHRAIAKGNIVVVSQLLEKGANPNAKDNAGMSPLKLAQWADRKDIAERLQAAGARE